MKTITVCALKGGVGKTSLCMNLAGYLLEQGKRVLLIDADDQANLTDALVEIELVGDDIDLDAIESYQSGMTRMMVLQHSAEQVIEPVSHLPGLSIITADDQLDMLSIHPSDPLGSLQQLRRKLADPHVTSNFDYSIIDTPRGAGFMTQNALVCSDYYVVPMDTDKHSFRGANRLAGVVDKIKEHSNPGLELAGYVLSRIDMRSNHAKMWVKAYRQRFGLKSSGGRLVETTLHSRIKFRHALELRQPVTHSEPKSEEAQWIRQVAKELGL